MKRVVLFPFTSNLLGGSYVSSSLIAHYLNLSAKWVPKIALPRLGPNAYIFEQAGLKPIYYNLGQKNALRIGLSSGYWGKLKASPAYMAAYRKAICYLHMVRPDIVHINDDETILTWGVAAHFIGLPVIWHIRQEKGNPLLDRIRLRCSNFIIFVADANRVRFKNISRLPPNISIYNGVDIDKFYPGKNRGACKARFGLDPDKSTIGFVGSLEVRKRPEWAVQAGVDLLKKGKDIQVLVAGKDYSGGDYERRLRRMVIAAGFLDRFHFLGFRRDTADLMRAVDILVLSSMLHGEAFPRVVIEAMASGAAVLATKVAGVPEAITDGVSGLLVDPDNYRDFLCKLNFLVDNQSYRENIAAGGLLSVHSLFSAGKCADKIMQVYEKVVGT